MRVKYTFFSRHNRVGMHERVPHAKERITQMDSLSNKFYKIPTLPPKIMYMHFIIPFPSFDQEQVTDIIFFSNVKLL